MIIGEKAIVLSGMKYRETSKILKLFTKNYGILSVMVQGVYKKNSSLYSVTETFAEAEYDLNIGKNFYFLRSAEIVDIHYNLRKKYSVVKAAQDASLFLLKILPEESKQEEIYILFKTLLLLLSKAKSPNSLTTAFIYKALSLLGYEFYLYACGQCGNRNIKKIYFSSSEASIFCENCKFKSGRQAFSKDEYRYLYDRLKIPLETLAQEEYRFEELKLRKLLLEYIESIYGYHNFTLSE